MISHLREKSDKINYLRNKILHGGSLKARTARGGLWLLSATIIEQVVRFIRNMIFTRLLAPEIFGLMAIVLAINALFESFTQVGIAQSIIQNPESSDKRYLNGAWWFSFIRSFGIYIVAFVATPYIAKFYNNYQLVNLMRFAFLSIIFVGLISCNAYIAQKRMDFKKWVLINQGGGLIGITITIILVYSIHNVWALVIGFTMEAFLKCVFSYIFCPFLPGIKFDKVHLTALFRYARGMLGLPILTFIFLRGDIFVVGKVVPMAALGLYSMAMILARTPFDLISNILNQLLSPVFSEVQENKEKVNYLVSICTMCFVYLGFPTVVFAIIFSKEILAIVYGTPYSVVSMPFSIILCSEVLRVTGVPIATFYLMSGKPELHRLFTSIRAILLVALIYFGVKLYGMIGAAIVILVSILISYGFQLKKMKEITGLDIWKYSSIFLKAGILSLFVIIFSLPLRISLGGESLIVIAGGLIGLLISVSLGILYVIKATNTL